jgi:hypothetical protein
MTANDAGIHRPAFLARFDVYRTFKRAEKGAHGRIVDHG